MSKSYNDWLNIAANYNGQLKVAISDDDYKNILYYRGKYLHALKQAYKLNPTLIVPRSVSGLSTSISIKELINLELKNHQKHISKYVEKNKKTSDIKGKTLSKELSLKIRRLSTRADQINFATNVMEKKKAKKAVAKDGLSFAGTAIKTPVMATAKVVSKVGPLAVTICLLPAKVLASLLRITVDASNGITSTPDRYNNTVVDQFSDTLKDAVKKVSKVTYEQVGRM